MEVGLGEYTVRKTQSTFSLDEGRRPGARESRPSLEGRRDREVDFSLKSSKMTAFPTH